MDSATETHRSTLTRLNNEGKKSKLNLRDTKQMLNLLSFEKDRSRRAAPSTETTAKQLELYEHS